MSSVRALVCSVVAVATGLVQCTRRVPSPGLEASVQLADASPDAKLARLGQPYFVDGGQAMDCEEGSPPVRIDPRESRTACWYAGASCAGHGTQVGEPFALKGTIVSGETVHGGCDLGT